MAMAEATETLFDTHAHIRALTGAGMPEAQAEAVVRLQVDVLQRHIVTKADAAAIRRDIADQRTWSEAEFGTLKTDVAALKTDVAALKTDVAALKTDVAALKTDVAALKTDVAALKDAFSNLTKAVDVLKTAKAETIKWVAGLNVATAALIITAIKIL